jgi:cytoskeleton protein RodZ
MTSNQTTAPITVASPPLGAEPAPVVTATPSQQGPGRQIRLAREAAHLSVEELAQQTKLAKSTLDALERDDFTLLNEAVYIRGYYRKVAKALSIAGQDLISAYEGMVKPKAPPAPTKLLLGSGDNGPQRVRRRLGWSWLLAIIIIGGLLFLALRFVGHTPSPAAGLSESLSTVDGTAPKPASATAEPSGSAATPLSSAPVSELPSTSTAPAAPPPADAAAAPTPAAELGSAAASTSVTAPSAPASSTASAAGTAGLVLDFKSTSWVRVEDSYGKVLLSGVIQAGQHQAVDGRRPLSVFLGNAHGVAVSYAGKSIDLAPYTKDNATARFSVP